MKTVSENTLKTRMDEVFKEIEATGEEVLVTHQGEMVMKIISYHRESADKDSKGKDRGSSS